MKQTLTRVSESWSLGPTERGLPSGAANPKARSQITKHDAPSSQAFLSEAIRHARRNWRKTAFADPLTKRRDLLLFRI
ncbi:hypothetical protein GGQ85_004218 [Nitrobacter vulgaris]|uniref:hypothetical protein n=1 Tax=Nitrobacter vulgaris TaxID=29421 RepID=UPI002854D58C|nr:hypothetical protein [Nitrobacter vulgaris]MDR6306485.1 hypothetical protein [Nitrobacter vulgaris]